MQGRTNLVIAHRLSTIKDADCIAVMGKGQIVEHGSYGELVEKRGAFFHLLEAQSLAVDDAAERSAGVAVDEARESRPASVDEKQDILAESELPAAQDDGKQDPTAARGDANGFISGLRTHDRPWLLVSIVFSILCGCLATAQSVVLSAVSTRHAIRKCLLYRLTANLGSALLRSARTRITTRGCGTMSTSGPG